MSRYFANEGLSTYTHVTDTHATYGTKIIVATRREAHYVLDEILGNATDLPITERHRHPRSHPGQLRPVRPARHADVPADPGPGPDHPLSAGPARRRRGPVPARGPAADPQG
nr:transposase [Nocardia otitidiscaviarum]